MYKNIIGQIHRGGLVESKILYIYKYIYKHIYMLFVKLTSLRFQPIYSPIAFYFSISYIIPQLPSFIPDTLPTFLKMHPLHQFVLLILWQKYLSYSNSHVLIKTFIKTLGLNWSFWHLFFLSIFHTVTTWLKS